MTLPFGRNKLRPSRAGGGLTATLKAAASTNAPRLVENVLNGRPVLDFGAAQGSQAQGAKNDPSMRFAISRNIRTVFSVLGSKDGGNTILGGTAGRNDALSLRTSKNTAIGIWRDVQAHPGDPSLPLVTTSGNTSSQMGSIADPAKTEFHKNGVVVNQKTEPMGGGYDLYSVKTITAHSMESDTLGGIHYAQSWGGVELGEIAYYERVLTPDEVADAESHLLLKWFNHGGPYRRPAEAGALSVAAGATLSLFGGAPMTVSALSGSGTVDGDVKFASGGGRPRVGACRVDHGNVGGMDVHVRKRPSPLRRAREGQRPGRHRPLSLHRDRVQVTNSRFARIAPPAPLAPAVAQERDPPALIWLGNGDSALSLDARQVIEESEMVYGSPISLWEVSNKCRKGKLQLKFPPRESGLTGFSNGIS